MEKRPLAEVYGKYFQELAKLSVAADKINETNIYQEGNPNTRKLLDKLVEENLLPESHLENIANFEKFYDLVEQGKHGLILMEHYQNTDLPAFCYMLEHSGNEKLYNLSKKIVAIAGMKLNEANPFVKAFAESFTRIVIYPTRSLNKNTDETHTEAEKEAEEAKAKKINFAAMRTMDNCKRNGQVILVFPSGTRYRPGHPETKRGLREIDSYLRLFDIAILVSVNGNILEITDENMLNDKVGPDKQIFAASDIIECKSFRKNFMASLPEDTPDPKQAIIDNIMSVLDKQHEQIEKIR